VKLFHFFILTIITDKRIFILTVKHKTRDLHHDQGNRKIRPLRHEQNRIAAHGDIAQREKEIGICAHCRSLRAYNFLEAYLWI